MKMKIFSINITKLLIFYYYSYLDEKHFSAPKQLPLVDGRYYHLENENIVRLYEFIPGKIFYNVPPCSNLLYHAGVYLGKLDEALKVKIPIFSSIDSITIFDSTIEFQARRI